MSFRYWNKWVYESEQVLEDGVLDPETTVVSIFPSPMHYAGPTDQIQYPSFQGKMSFFDPSRPQDFLFISGTKMRTLAKNKETLRMA